MSLTVNELTAEALKLPGALRAELVQRIAETLDVAPKPEMERAWIEEALRRRDELLSGTVKAMPGDEVLAEARRRAAAVSLKESVEPTKHTKLTKGASWKD